MAKDSPGLVFSHGFPVGERIVSALYQPRIRPKPPVKINKGGPRIMYSDIWYLLIFPFINGTPQKKTN